MFYRVKYIRGGESGTGRIWSLKRSVVKDLNHYRRRMKSDNFMRDVSDIFIESTTGPSVEWKRI